MAKTVHTVDVSTMSPDEIKALAQAELFQAQAKQARAETKWHRQETRKARAEAVCAELEVADALDLDNDKRASDDSHRHMNLGEVTSSSVQKALYTLGRWHRTTPNCDITLVLNSPGGSVIDGMALWDYLTYLKSSGHHLTTVCQGMAASMGSILFQAGDVRIMGAESVMLIHEVSFGAGGKIGEVEDTVKFAKILERRAVGILAARSTLTPAQIAARSKGRDWWMDSIEALKLGFADQVR